jgi:hypothetical protein
VALRWQNASEGSASTIFKSTDNEKRQVTQWLESREHTKTSNKGNSEEERAKRENVPQRSWAMPLAGAIAYMSLSGLNEFKLI